MSDAPLRVFCFHCAGGSAGQFLQWNMLGGGNVTFAGVQLPGRERRYREPPPQDFPHLIGSLSAAIRPVLDRPYAFFGHSLGALVAFELARALRASSVPPPRHLFVASRSAPQLARDFPALDELPLPRLLEVLRRYGGINEAMLGDADVMSGLLPTIRADFRLVRRYVYRYEPSFDFPITALGGSADEFCSESDLRAWGEQTRAQFRCNLLAGGHFFLREHAATVVTNIVRTLLASE
jgi:myxalamid-type polyketide synthase MxaE and MxaD/epothilone polyketide synthase D